MQLDFKYTKEIECCVFVIEKLRYQIFNLYHNRKIILAKGNQPIQKLFRS